MLEIARAVVTVLILIFSGLTFWHQFLRTPRSDVGVSIIEREEPYSTNSGAITFSGPIIQLYNRGDMEGIVDTLDVSVELVDSETGNLFPPPEEGKFDISLRSPYIRDTNKLAPGSNEQVRPKVNIRNVSKFPAEFWIKTSYKFKIRDNFRIYELSSSDKFKFVNQQAMD